MRRYINEMFKSLQEFIKYAESDLPSQVYICQWQKTPSLNKGYVVYRWTVAIIFTVLYFFTLIEFGRKSFFKILIYLTHWAFIICVIQAVLAAFIVTNKYRKLKISSVENEKENLVLSKSLVLKVYGVLYSMSVVNSIGITAIFWIRIYNPVSYGQSFALYIQHGVNTIFMLIDVITVAHSIKFLHFFWTFSFFIIYILFSYIYYLAGGTDWRNYKFIYSSLNWSKPGNALIFCISSILFGFIVHICAWSLSAFIRKISGVSNYTAYLEENVQ